MTVLVGYGHRRRIANVSTAMQQVGQPRRATALPALRVSLALVAVAMALIACGLLPGSSLSPRELALRQLAANQALWAQKAPKSYAITVERQCFCPTAQYDIVVTDGIVTQVTHDGAPVQPAEVQGLPKTVPELFAVVAGLPPEASVEVTFSPDLGFPSFIKVDPIPNAVDDEYTIVVHKFQAR